MRPASTPEINRLIMSKSLSAHTVLVTGYPLDAAKRLVAELVAGGDRVVVLARDKFEGEARLWAKALEDQGPGAAEVLVGDILALDLGLSGAQVRKLQSEIQQVHHLAAVHYLGIDAPRMREVNVEGLREVLELALGMTALRRVCVWSTVFVAGARTGLVYETDLMQGQSFRNAYEQTKAQAEQLARAAMAQLPITVVRLPILVGDSRTGEAGRIEGVSAVAAAIVHSPTPVELPVSGHHALHIAPVDYAVNAAIHLARHPDAAGGTYQLVDEQPLTAKAFFDAVADAAGRPRPTVSLAGRLQQNLRRLPTLSGDTRHQRSFLEWFDASVRFDASRARALLAGSGVSCPRVAEYIDAYVAWLREQDL